MANITSRTDLQLIPSVTDPSILGRRKEQLFEALDGSRIRLPGDELALEVYSIRDEVAGRWIQFGIRGTDTQATLRLPRQAGFRQAREALLRWVADPNHAPDSGAAA